MFVHQITIYIYPHVYPHVYPYIWCNKNHLPKKKQCTYIIYSSIYYGGTPMRHRKTACFEALVLEPHFAQSCGRFLLLYCLLGWRTSLQRLKVAAHVLVKSWFAAPLPCTFQCFVRKVKNADRKHFALAPNPAVLLGFCAPSSVVSVASGWWVGDFSLVLGF